MIFPENKWKAIFEEETNKDYFQNIISFLSLEKEKWEIIFPKEEDIFSAFNYCDLDNLKVVIIWQDPYHWENQAHWLSFSVKKWNKLPPSLKNIYKEMKSDLWFDRWDDGDLTNLAKQWILFLNASLTVKKSSPNSHSKIWWQFFSDNIISHINDKKTGVIFVLWWNFAIEKEKLIDKNKHFILKSPHPSPFSARKWFFWSNVFSKINDLLSKKWDKKIDWSL